MDYNRFSSLSFKVLRNERTWSCRKLDCWCCCSLLLTLLLVHKHIESKSSVVTLNVVSSGRRAMKAIGKCVQIILENGWAWNMFFFFLAQTFEFHVLVGQLQGDEEKNQTSSWNIGQLNIYVWISVARTDFGCLSIHFQTSNQRSTYREKLRVLRLCWMKFSISWL